MTTSTFSGTSPRIRGREDLLLSFRAGEKPPERWRVGTEHEKFGFLRESGQPLAYEGARGIRAVLEQFIARFGWQAVMEGETLIALQREGSSITLEPGGQLELSGAPLASTHEAQAELEQHLAELGAISLDLNLIWLNVGRTPSVPSSQMPWMPKERYAIMGRYLPTQGSMARDMMVGTCTVQTNMDYSSEADMALKLRVALAAGPLITALYANSPFADGRPTGMVSTRAEVWRHTDPHRCGVPDIVFREGFGYEAWMEYALDVPMFFIHRGGHYVDTSGQSFRDFLARGIGGEWPTQEDWVLHLTTLFPEARLKSYLELRMADVGPPAMIVALAALTRGLFYEPGALAQAATLLADLGAERVRELQQGVIRQGLRAQALGRSVQEWLKDLLALAQGGLRRLNVRNARGQDETRYLDPLLAIVDSGQTQADALLRAWEQDWGRSLTPLLAALGYP